MYVCHSSEQPLEPSIAYIDAFYEHVKALAMLTGQVDGAENTQSKQHTALSLERQKGLTISDFYIQLDPFECILISSILLV